MKDKVNLSVVLPSYLEEENLRLLLPRLKDVFLKIEPRYEILVVDTVTPMDDTKEVCEQNGARYINRRKGNCFGDGVRTGIEEAKGNWILFMDADGSHAPEFIPQLYRLVTQYDILIASRYVAGGYTENTRLLALLSQVLNWTYSFVLSVKCKDVSNSFKIYRSDLLRGIPLHCNNFDIVEEILVKICRKHKDVRIKEVPFTFKKRMFGETKRSLFLFILSYLYTLVRLRFGK